MPSPRLPAASPPHYAEPPAAAGHNVSESERLASAIGGGLLALYGLSRKSVGGALLAGIGGALVYRGTTGHCPVYGQLGISTAEGGDASEEAVEIVESVTVNVPRSEAYAFWRKLENLPRFMHHIRTVEEVSPTRSKWTAKGPGPLPDLMWEADILEDVPNERIVWQSLPDADVNNAGHVSFRDAPGDGTEVHTRISYRPPAGAAGRAVARRLDPVFGQMVKNDVRRFKNILETGEVPTTEGQPTGKDGGSRSD